jgi:hypothetical protein
MAKTLGDVLREDRRLLPAAVLGVAALAVVVVLLLRRHDPRPQQPPPPPPPPPAVPNILGTWQLSDGSATITLEFFANKSCRMEKKVFLLSQTKLASYQLEAGGVLTLHPTDAPGRPMRSRVEVLGAQMTLTDPDGTVSTFVRIR